MFFQSSDVSRWHISLRFAVLLLIPASLIVCLLYAAQAQEESAHAHNLRWLAQMATQITNRVQVRSDFVRVRAEQPRSSKPGPKDSERQPGAAAHYSIDNLVPASCDPKTSKNLTIVDEGAESWLFFQSSGDHDQCAKANLKKLVEPTIRTDAFTSVILAQRGGRVLYQSGPDSLRITDVGFLFTRSGDDRGKPLAGGTPAKDAPTGSAPTSSVHLTSQIGDASFQVFVQPLSLRAESRPKDADWILIGISEKRNLLRSSAPSDLMLILPLVLLLLGMGWPLQRLWSMAPFEALRRRNVVVIGLCSLGVVVLLSLLVVYEYSQRLSMARADEQLHAFAETVGHNFKTELKLAVDQLYELDKIAASSKAESQTSILKNLLKPENVQLPFEYADWIDAKGDKIQRWTTNATAPQLVNVADRPYFMQARWGTAPVLPGISTEPVAIQQVLSRTTGKAMTMLGIRSGVKGITVASLSLNLVSLSEPVAPRDLGFAIIDPHGMVLFHSERRRMFVENLFEESQQSGELKSVVQRRIPAFVNLDYDAAPHRMFVTPIPGVERLDWTLVAFRKLAANRIGRMQVLVDTSALLCLYGLGLALAVVIGRLLAGLRVLPRYSSLVNWWGSLSGGRMYVAGAGFFLAVIIGRAFERFHGADLLCVAVASGLAFLMITTIGLRYPAGGRRLRTRPSPGGFGRVVTRARRRVWRVAGVPVVLGALGLCLGDWFMAAAAPAATLIWGVLVCQLFHAVPEDRHSRMLDKAWLVWGVEAALVLCMAPALLLSRLSYEFESGLRLRDSQLWLSTVEKQRHWDVGHAIDLIPGVEKSGAIREKLQKAVGLSPSESLPEPLYYYGTGISRVSLLRDHASTQDNACGLDTPADRGPKVTIASALSSLALASIELPNEDRLMGPEARKRALEPAHSLWTWDERGRVLCLYSGTGDVQGSAPLPVFDPFQIREESAHASSPGGERVRKTGPLISSAPVWAALIGILAAVALWMNRLRRRLLLMGAASIEGSTDPVYDGSSPIPARLFLLVEAGTGRGAVPESLSSYQRIDLASEEWDAKTLQNLSANGLLLDRFESRFQDPQVRKARLELLEAARLVMGKPIAIRSAIDCVSYLASGGSGDSGAVDETELKSWFTLMNHFERRTLPRVKEGPWDYSAIWDSCSELERDVLMHLCRHGMVNPRASQVVGVLLRRGLIQRTRRLGLRFFQPEFCRFVGDATVLVREKRSAQLGSGRLPAYAIGLLLLGFVLLFSQEELTTRLIGFLTTLTGGFETIRKQLVGIQGTGGTSKS